MRAMSHHVVNKLFPKPEQSELRARLIARASSNDRDAYVAAVHALKGWSVERRLGEIRTPTLVIAGEEDPATTVEMVRLIADGIAGSTFRTVPGAGHLPNATHPDVVNDAIAAFLR
jgi:3-oxoadipate enol-lactonase